MFKFTFLKVAAGILATLFILVFVLGGISLFSAMNGHHFIVQANQATELDFKITSSDTALNVCEPIKYHTQFETSLNYQMDPVVGFDLPEGLQMIGKPQLKAHYGVNHWLYDLDFALIAYRDTIYNDVKMSIKATSLLDAASDTTWIVSLPALHIEQGTSSDSQLALAGEIEPDIEPVLGRWLWAIVTGILLLICAIAWYVMRRKELELIREIEPWVEGETDLVQLQEKVKKDDISTERAVARITDIVRHYLTRRFKLRADAMTTLEFFKNLEQHDSPLDKDHKQFLIEFLNAADLIKFAGLAASSDMVLSAIARALKLIYETTPHEQESEK